jgi:hypothetical protein
LCSRLLGRLTGGLGRRLSSRCRSRPIHTMILFIMIRSHSFRTQTTLTHTNAVRIAILRAFITLGLSSRRLEVTLCTFRTISSSHKDATNIQIDCRSSRTQ